MACSSHRNKKNAMKPALPFLCTFTLAAALVSLSAPLQEKAQAIQQSSSPGEAARNEQGTPRAFLGFDRNVYPGDDALPALRATFSFVGFWLNPAPGEKTNTWSGKRQRLLSQGFGFLVLYRGRETREVKEQNSGIRLGDRDASDAAGRAKLEGFAPGTTIFLDVEEGGRLPGPYHVYLLGWLRTLKRLHYRAGIYCSGMPVNEVQDIYTTTADDISGEHALTELVFWVYNDACPPSPGCALADTPPAPSVSGISYAAVWQFAQSPRRQEFTAHCPPGYHTDGNCYAPGDTAHAWHLDLNSAASPDPSNGR